MSAHPLAKAIVREGEQRGVQASSASALTVRAGQGITAQAGVMSDWGRKRAATRITWH